MICDVKERGAEETGGEVGRGEAERCVSGGKIETERQPEVDRAGEVRRESRDGAARWKRPFL